MSKNSSSFKYRVCVTLAIFPLLFFTYSKIYSSWFIKEDYSIWFFPQTVTLSYINEEKFTIDWVYNILEHKKESERIVYEDLDPETGFVLLPDFKWSCKQIEDLYLLAIVQRRNLKSIRDLNHRHLPLLEKLWKDGTRAIQGILT